MRKLISKRHMALCGRTLSTGSWRLERHCHFLQNDNSLFSIILSCFLEGSDEALYFPAFDTTPPGYRRFDDSMAGKPSFGNLTPPRISPSCPHCLYLWLDRKYHDRLTGSSQNSLPLLLSGGWVSLCTLFTVFFIGRRILMFQVVVAHLPARFSLLGPSADVVRHRIFNFQRTNRFLPVNKV